MPPEWQTWLSDIAGEQLHRLVYEAALQMHLPVVFWRLPHQKRVHGLVDFCGWRSVEHVDFQDGTPGFIFSPFAVSERLPVVKLSAGLYLENTEGFLIAKDHQRQVDAFSEHIYGLAKRNGHRRPVRENWYIPRAETALPDPVRYLEYCRLVETAIRAIEAHELRKVVLSRAHPVALTDNFHPFRLFEKLCLAYPRAFVSLVALPEIGTWVGATPELLMRVQDGELTTVALAGTTVARPDVSNPWGQKEIDEQEIVSEFIRGCFDSLNCHSYVERGPETVRIGNLLHLKTQFSVAATGLKDSFITHLLQLMHPTPAVCGVPKLAALQFIERREPHDRCYYAGYLGPVNLNNSSSLFVNLRCLQVLRQHAVLYAGGGITADSVPEQEWQEIELKLDALLSLLHHEQPISKQKNQEKCIVDG